MTSVPFRRFSRRYGARAAARNLAAAASLALAVISGVSATAAAAQEAPVVAALGDSLTQGYGLPQAEGLVPQLQNWLSEQGVAVAMVNAGVSGDTTAGGLSRIEWTLADGVDALIIALGGNDLLRGLPPEETRANVAAMLDVARDRGIPVLLVGLQAPGNYGAEYKAAFDAIWPELSAEYGTLLVANMLAGISDLSPEDRLSRNLIQDDGIHPSAEGVQLLVGTMGPKIIELLGRVR